MTDELPVAAASPDIRPIVWRGYPLHYAIPVVVGLIGILFLLLGGAAAWFGGWWLATAFPIAIGSFFRDPRLAAVPVLVWALWLVVGALAGPDAALANTPIPVAVALAAAGAAGTYLAQRLIFPATDPEVVEAIRNGRTVPTLDDGADADPLIEPLPVEDAEDLDPALVELFEVAEEPDGAEADAEADDETDADDEPESDDDADEPEADDETDAADKHAAEADDAESEPEADEPEAEVDDEADDAEADEPEAEDEPEADADDEPEDPLDEGQHVAEFAAITEADLEQADSDGPLPAATRAGKHQGKA